MNEQTYINQIGKNLLAAAAELPRREEITNVMKVNYKDSKLNDNNATCIDIENLYKLQSFYLGIYYNLSVVNPETVELPDYKATYPVDRKKFDKCVDRVLRMLLTLYAIGFLGEYVNGDVMSEGNDEKENGLVNKTAGGLIQVNQQTLLELCKTLKVTALNSVLNELNQFGIGMKKENSQLKVWFANDTEGILAKYHCIYANYIGQIKPEDTKAISKYFRCDFSSLLNQKQKKINEENFMIAALSQDKAEMLSEMISILNSKMNCRTEIKMSFYKGILNGSLSAAYKHRKTGRTLVSLDTKAGEIILRLNFTPQTVGKVFLMTDEFSAEVFDNIKQCYCKGSKCMGHDGVFIPEAGISFCDHIIKYELRELQKTTFDDFCRLLYVQYGFLNENENFEVSK